MLAKIEDSVTEENLEIEKSVCDLDCPGISGISILFAYFALFFWPLSLVTYYSFYDDPSSVNQFFLILMVHFTFAIALSLPR